MTAKAKRVGWQKVDGERVRELRAERMLSLRDVAKISGLSFHTVGELERGNRRAQPRTVRALAKALKVKHSEILLREDDEL
jgi:transcriptional regulator with XRE-family HTH domain